MADSLNLKIGGYNVRELFGDFFRAQADSRNVQRAVQQGELVTRGSCEAVKSKGILKQLLNTALEELCRLGSFSSY